LRRMTGTCSPGRGSGRPAEPPDPRYLPGGFTGGSAKVTATGSAKIDQEIAINIKASYGDGGMTWLQFGESGSEAPNVLSCHADRSRIGARA
jgi:hypothetical protein